MRGPLTAASLSALLLAGATAKAQTSPPAWSSQNSQTGCSDRKGCHGAAIASAILGAIPSVTLVVEVASGTRARLALPLRFVLMAVGAASIVAGAWDGYAYRSDGPANYLPGPIIGGVLGGGSILGNIILLTRPAESDERAALQTLTSLTAGPVWMRDASGASVPGAGISGVLF